MSHHAVIRFVPDPVAGEYINIGVLATRTPIGTGPIKVRTLRDWTRVGHFAQNGEVVAFVRATVSAWSVPGALTHRDVAMYQEAYRSIVQIGEWLGATLTPAEVLEDVAAYLLKDRL